MPDTPKLLQVGDVAERVGLSLRTVRYYEEQGLLDARDALGSGDSDAAAVHSRSADDAAQRCAKLAEQLRRAEGLAGQLRREAGTASR